jgi:hypothetical protein
MPEHLPVLLNAVRLSGGEQTRPSGRYLDVELRVTLTKVKSLAACWLPDASPFGRRPDRAVSRARGSSVRTVALGDRERAEAKSG